MKRALLLLALLAPTASFAAFSGASRGNSAATFLTLGAGARAAAMAGAQTASADGGFALGYNPAGLALRHAVQFDLMHADWFEEAAYEVGAAALPVGDSSVIGVGFQQFTVGDLERRDTAGFQDGTFQPEDSALTIGWAREAGDGYRWGLAAKYIRSEILDSAQTGAVDFGVVSPEEKGRRWGAAVQNIGGSLKFDSKKESLPVMVAAGGTQRWKNLLLAGDLKLPRDNTPYAAVAAELGLPMGESWRGAARLGYSSRSLAAPGGLTGLTTGFGIGANWFSLDYAFAPFGDLGAVHLFSLSIRGGEKSRP